ncbi:MAG: NADPH-dependent FMN reductase [Pseudonocardiaceae bacterium]
MAPIVVLSGSPSATSKTAAVLDLIALRLVDHGHQVRTVPVRELPAAALLSGDTSDPAIAEVVASIGVAGGLVVASPVYKAAYTGLLKSLLDLQPPHALAGKAVFPLVTGGTPAHVLALEYALRPVLAAMGGLVGQGYFLLDHFITRDGEQVRIADEAQLPLLGIVDAFAELLSAYQPVTVALK